MNLYVKLVYLLKLRIISFRHRQDSFKR